MNRHIARQSGVLACLTAVIVTLFTLPASAQDCDRNCLSGLMTQFLDALLAHDASTLPLADDYRYTEDSANARLGEGIWQSITSDGGFRQDYIDLRKQVAATHVLMYEGDTSVLYSAAPSPLVSPAM